MPESDLDLLIAAARRAGKVACPFWRQSPEVWEKSGGAGPVSEADLKVDDMLRETLLSARPNYGWLSEESDDAEARASNHAVFVIDPIDGTRAFIAGENSWSHSLAIAKDGKITDAVVFLPAQDKLYSASLGGGAYLNGQPIRCSETANLSGASVLAGRYNFDPKRWPGGLPEFKRHFRPSLAYRLALVAEGRFDAMLALSPTWEWDVAAGSLIASEAGAKVTDNRFQALTFNNPSPKLPGIVAAGPKVYEGIRKHLQTPA